LRTCTTHFSKNVSTNGFFEVQKRLVEEHGYDLAPEKVNPVKVRFSGTILNQGSEGFAMRRTKFTQKPSPLPG